MLWNLVIFFSAQKMCEIWNLSFFCFIQLRRRLYDDDSNFYCVFISDRIFKNRISIEFFVKWNAINNWCDWILLLIRKSIGFHVRKTFKKSAFFCDKDEFYMKWKISSKYLLKYFQKARSKNLCKQEKLQKQLLYKQFERKWQNARFSTFFREITGLHKIHRK